MGIFDKIRYTKALLVILPLGMVLLYLGIDYLFNSASSASELKKVEGAITRIYSEPVYIDQCSCYLKTIFIEIENNTDEYFNREKAKVDLLNTNLTKGDIVILGYDRYGQIQSLNVEGKLLIKYKKSNLYSYVFMIIGAFLILLSIFYLVTQKKDLE
tara:strand:+ start:4969 stop:5439 length:471 start_codon:yes stop_codon:yes gene_type:complete